ncbi:hypothetical protein LINGRAHAP2_LOCUS22762 [Linum grandiflorum]
MYLRHIWRLCDPSKPDQLFALGTIWTDGELFVFRLWSPFPIVCLIPLTLFF